MGAGMVRSDNARKELFKRITEVLEIHDKELSIGYDSSSKHSLLFHNEELMVNQFDSDLYEIINDIYKQWCFENIVSQCELVDLEINLSSAFQSGLTPLIIDNSEGSRVCTFYGYQLDAIILDAKTLITDFYVKKRSLQDCLENARKILVNAMKWGKLLVIRLDSSVPDFLGTFNDQKLDRNNTNDTSYFPIELFENGGKLLREDEIWAKRLFREEDMKPHKNIAFC
eukprot:gene11780-15761_t